MSIDPALRLIARSLPPLARDRYLEEWRSDADGAEELGLRRRDVVLGAAAMSLTIDRDLPAHTGEPRGTLPRRLARRGFALLAAAAVILIGGYLTGGGIVPEGGAATSGVLTALEAAGWIALRAALLVAVLGAIHLARAATVVETRTARATLIAAIAGPALVIVGTLTPGTSSWFILVGLAIIILGFAGGVAVVGGTRPIALLHRVAPLRHRVVAAVVGTMIVSGVVVVGAIDLLIWNPIAKVPGMELSAIYSLMASRDGFDLAANAVVVGVWAAIWIGAALAVLMLAVLPRNAAFTPRRSAIIYFCLIGGAIFFRFFTGFGFGMSIADTFATSGGDGSVVSAILPYVGQLALAGAAVAFGWAPRVAPRAMAAA